MIKLLRQNLIFRPAKDRYLRLIVEKPKNEYKYYYL